MKSANREVLKKSCRLEMRITEADKKCIVEKARAFGISMAEIVTNLIKDMPLTDRRVKDEKFWKFILCVRKLIISVII